MTNIYNLSSSASLWNMCLAKDTKHNSMEKSLKLGQPVKNRQIRYVTVRGPFTFTYILLFPCIHRILYDILTRHNGRLLKMDGVRNMIRIT